ncbi:MAG: response regulator [Chloroflexi bacterium]|nr:response regulator [Chloroflexota bacterium]
MKGMISVSQVDILLVEDSPGDVRLTMEALADAKISNNITVASDGIEALAVLRKEGQFADAVRPDLILLDLNMPRMDGRELLGIIKEDSDLKNIPVVVLTTSQSEADILESYDLRANCYITKPVDLDQFLVVVNSIQEFWLSIVKLPTSQAA